MKEFCIDLDTLKAAQIQEEEYFGHLVADDLSDILRDVREDHRTDALTADDELSAAAVLLALGLGCVVYLLYHFWGGGQE